MEAKDIKLAFIDMNFVLDGARALLEKDKGDAIVDINLKDFYEMKDVVFHKKISFSHQDFQVFSWVIYDLVHYLNLENKLIYITGTINSNLLSEYNVEWINSQSSK